MAQQHVVSEQEKRIYKDQIALPDIGENGQNKIKKARVLVIGAGGKGTAVLQQLAKAGVGKLGISDNYLISEDELPRQILHGTTDLGKLKAIAVKDKLLPANNFTDFYVHNICLSKDNILPIISDYDILVDTTDNFPARYLINDAAIITEKPWVFGSVFNSKAMISVFNYQGGPSLRCHFPEAPENAEKPTTKGLNAWGILLNIAGSIIAHEVLNIILEKPSNLSGNMLHFNILEYSSTYEQVVKNKAYFTITDFLD